ncbi:MAG: hypothetical protein ABIP51_07840 [Bacteroidia bacterium]
MKQSPLIVTKNTFNLKRGTVLENYTTVRDGIITENKDFLSNKNFVLLTEKLSTDDEKRVREIIKQQIRVLLWNLYTKNSILLP